MDGVQGASESGIWDGRVDGRVLGRFSEEPRNMGVSDA